MAIDILSAGESSPAHDKKTSRFAESTRTPARQSAALSWLKANAEFKGDECLIWPFSRSEQGYGWIRFKGKVTNAHRVMCELVYGAPPLKNSHASHSCGMGHLGCVNPSHLRWDSRSGNFADKLKHGTDSRGEKSSLAKVSNSDVLRIRSLRGIKSQSAIAAEYGLTQPTISKIQSGKKWSWMPL